MMHAEFQNPFVNARIVGKSVNTADYLAQDHKRGELGFVMSSSDIRNFRKCPEKWVNGHKDDGTKSTTWGDLIDCLITNPERFEKEFAVRPATYNGDGETKKWNANAKVCKEWLDKHAHLTVVSPDELLSAKSAADRLKKNRDCGPFLESCTARQVYVVAEYRDDDTGLVIPVKSLTDLVPDVNHPSDYRKSLADLKTGKDASPDEWRTEVYYRGYHVQAAWHLDIYVAATGEERIDFRHVIQENYPPFQTASRIVSSEFLQLGRTAYLTALKLYCKCLKSGEWPGYDYDARNQWQGWAIVEPLPWMMTA